MRIVFEEGHAAFRFGDNSVTETTNYDMVVHEGYQARQHAHCLLPLCVSPLLLPSFASVGATAPLFRPGILPLP